MSAESSIAPGERYVALVTVADPDCRASIADALHGRGWTVVEQPTGFHLLQAIADVIDAPEGQATQPGAVGLAATMPRLLVVDAIARGLAGITIAAGLRELDVRIPLVLVTRPGERVPVSEDQVIHVVSSAAAPALVAELAGELATEKVAAEAHQSHGSC